MDMLKMHKSDIYKDLTTEVKKLSTIFKFFCETPFM